MCGIVAAWGRTDPAELRNMMNPIRHRGPDGDGLLSLGDATLGHLRLAILDLAGGGQPMTNEDATLAIAFNGEIYNHRDLRRKLESRHVFRTRSDTEVLLHLYEESGEDMLGRLDGMFALALAGPGGMLLARDTLGIKPLYFGQRSGAVLAASELKAFPRMDTLEMLPAGHAVMAGGKPWRFALPYPPQPVLREPTLPEAISEIRRQLDEAVVKRLMSDVPVGVYLSGGLDSSVIAALMRPHTVKLHSFTAGMEGAPDLLAAREVARYLDTEHHELIYTPEDVRRALPEVIWHMESFDAPLVRSAVPMFFVSRVAAQHVKVVLSGEGADELFAGYAYLSQLNTHERLRQELSDITIRLQDTNLQRADRMSMAHGLEARVPFLDLAMVRYAARLPCKLIAPHPDRPEKWLLREACKGLIPPAILNRKKMKFSEGAGSANVAAEFARTQVSPEEFERCRHIPDAPPLRSPEELCYYFLWRDAFGAHVSPALVGRTMDRSAAC